MAFSDVLQFDCFIDNEIARNATKDFAQVLGKAFEQYKKLWLEYLKLRKHCEDAAFNIPFRILETDKCNKDNVKSDTSQVSSDSTKKSASVYESVYTSCASHDTSDLEDDVFCNQKHGDKQIEEGKLLRSPILVKKRSKSKRTNLANNEPVFESSTEDIIPIKENVSILSDSFNENIETKELKKNQCLVAQNDTEVKCTSTSKTPVKLGVSKLYNVDTTLLQNGKKLKQSTIVFLPSEQPTENVTYKRFKKSSPLKSHVSPTPEKNIKARNFLSRSDKKYIGEDIIESSPRKCTKSNLKVKSFKLKRKSPMKQTMKSEILRSSIIGAFSDKSTNNNLATEDTNQSSLSQYFMPIHSSTQKEQSPLIKRSKTFGSSYGNVKSVCDFSGFPVSPTLANIQDSCLDGARDVTSINSSTKVNETMKNDEFKENISQTEKRKYSGTDIQMFDTPAATFDDETFYLSGENEKPNCGKGKNAKENAYENYILPESSSVKKSLMNSFDILPEKKETSLDKPSKKRSDRAKMTGVSCWECKKYYTNLGLSEEEIEARQQQCSRHRTKSAKREGTPEGFWDPVFPDTFSSTFQDD